jgi:hypothetical protein
MPKNKKYLKKNKNKKILKDASDIISLEDQIREISKGLFYISETDAEIIPFVGEKAEAVTQDEILKQTKNEKDVKVEERDFEDFFDRLTKFQYWYESEEMAQAKNFYELKKLLEENLRDIKVFRIGKIKIDIYAVGLDKENRLVGIKTIAVET